MKRIKFLFWNLYKKNMIAPILQLITENNTDIFMVAECENLDIYTMFEQLRSFGESWKNVEFCPSGTMRLFAKQQIDISVIKEEKHYSCFLLRNQGISQLISTIHLVSALYKDENARSERAKHVSQLLTKIEHDLFQDSELKSIIVGDFNLQPYSQGIAGIFGFNATMSSYKAKSKIRKVDGSEYNFYYNPMWHLMGQNKKVQGTYYNNSDQSDLSLFWYSFDEVLIRPYFIDRFNWEYFNIIEETHSYKFMKGHKINKNDYSDHLPIRFEII